MPGNQRNRDDSNLDTELESAGALRPSKRAARYRPKHLPTPSDTSPAPVSNQDESDTIKLKQGHISSPKITDEEQEAEKILGPLTDDERLNWLTANPTKGHIYANVMRRIRSKNTTAPKDTVAEGINPAEQHSTPADLVEAIQRDWNNDYYPHSLNVLRALIGRYQTYRIKDYYAKTLVFVQSSGMGKSRLADTYGQHCPMISFVLRQPGTLGFPPPDEEILEFLPDPPKTKPTLISPKYDSKDHLAIQNAVELNHTRSTALLQASFEILNTWVESTSFATMTLQELASLRHSDMAPLQLAASVEGASGQRSEKRIEFCKSVVQRAEVIAADLSSRADWTVIFNDRGAGEVHRRLEEAFKNTHPGLFNAANKLLGNLQQCKSVGNKESCLVIVFDEASSLITTNSKAARYTALNRTISCLKQFPLWTFFLSTESRIGDLVPPTSVERSNDYLRDSSLRVVPGDPDRQLKRFPPFVSLQLDIEDRRRMQDPKLRGTELLKPLAEFAKLDHMASFGRPLWHIYKTKGENLMRIAKAKLIGGKRQESYHPGDADHVFAALSFRLSLDVCLQNPRSVRLARDAVNHYMRVVLHMDEDTGAIDTITPSEPILARAAMEILYYNWLPSIATLATKLLNQGLIEKGLKGELYARLVLILAHDFVRWVPTSDSEEDLSGSSEGHQSLHSTTDDGFTPTFTVFQFLTALYADAHHKLIMEIPKEILEARMNFTHFVQAFKSLTAKVIPDLCHDLLRRSAAMQLSWQQETYDILIPIYYGQDNEQFDPAKCGVILIQVKNKAKSITPKQVLEEDFDTVDLQGKIKGRPKAKTKGEVKGKANVSSNKDKQSDKREETINKREPTTFIFNEMKNPILFLLFNLGAERSARACAPLVQVMHSNSGLQPDLWAINSQGYNADTFGCLDRMGVSQQATLFFTAVQGHDTEAARLAQRNRTFFKLERDFRYELQTEDDEE